MSVNTYNKGEITFEAIFALIRRSIVRIVVYVLIAAIVVGSAGAIFMLLNKTDETYQAAIQFNYEGVEDGLDPWGRELDVSKIKSDRVITDALVENNFSDEQRAEIKGDIKDNLSIAGVVPEDIMEQILIVREIATENPEQLNEIKELSYNSTSFVITLTNTKEINLTEKECIAVLNSIVDKYISNFKSTYGFNDVLGSLIGEEVDYEGYDYVELYDVYNTQVEDILRYLDYIIEEGEGSEFRSTENKMTFEDLKSRVESIKDYSIKALETYIFEFGITSTDASIEVQTYIQEKLDNIDIEVDSTQNLLDDTERAMTEIFEPYYNTKKDINGNEEEVLANGEIYQTYSDNLVKYQTQLVQQTTEKTLWENRLTKFNDATELTAEERQEYIQKANSMLEEINSDLTTEINFINETVDEYIESEVMKDSIQKSIAAVNSTEYGFDIKVFILVEILAMFIAFLVALGVTSKKEKKGTNKGLISRMEYTGSKENKKIEDNEEKQKPNN